MIVSIPGMASLEELSLQSIAADVPFLLLFVGLSLVLGIFFRRSKLIHVLINTYIALALLSVFPRDWYAFAGEMAKAGTFVLILGGLTAIDRRLFDLHISSSGSDVFWRLIVMSLLVAGMLASILLAFFPQTITKAVMTEHVFFLFVTSPAPFLWLVAPILVLLFVNNRLK